MIVENAKEGDWVPELHLPPITRLQLALYCGGSGDHNPIHVDSDAAKEAGMKDVFAHGMLSMAFMGRLVTSLFPHRSVISLGVRFIAITWVGDEITVKGQIKSIDRVDRRLSLDLTCTNQHNHTTLKGEAWVTLDQTASPIVHQQECT